MTAALAGALWRVALAHAVVAVPCPPAHEPAAPAAQILPDGFVDRIESGLAVIVVNETRWVHRPACDLREGDVLRGGRPEAAARDALERRVRARRAVLASGDDGEDLEL